MMHKAWSSIGEVPYCFSRTCVKFQGHTGQKIADFDPNWAFPDYNFSLNSPMALKWCTTLCGIEQVLYCFSKSSIKFQGHTGQKNHQFWSQLSVCGLQLKFDFTDGFEMMHKAWWCIQEVPYCFRGHPSDFTTTQAENRRFESNLRLLGRSQLSNPSDLPCFCIWAIMIRY